MKPPAELRLKREGNLFHLKWYGSRVSGSTQECQVKQERPAGLSTATAWAPGVASGFPSTGSPYATPRPTQGHSTRFTVRLFRLAPSHKKARNLPVSLTPSLPVRPPPSGPHLVIVSVYTGVISLENESLLEFRILLILYMF